MPFSCSFFILEKAVKSIGNAVIPTLLMHRSHGLQGSLKRRYKHPSPTSINGYHTAKKLLSQSSTNGPRSLSFTKAGIHSPLPIRSHTAVHTAKHVVFRMGALLLPSECSTRFENSAWPGLKTANFAAFGSWLDVLPKNAGVAAPLGCVIFSGLY